jgi:hypothetical protein
VFVITTGHDNRVWIISIEQAHELRALLYSLGRRIASSDNANLLAHSVT